MLEVKTFIVTGAELEQGMSVSHANFGESPGTYPGRQAVIGSCTLRIIKKVEYDKAFNGLRVWFFDVDHPTFIRTDDKILIVKTVEGLNL